MIWPLAVCGLVLGCAPGATDPGSGPPEIGSVRLFDRGEDITGHVPLGAGQTLRIEVRLYGVNGNRITPADGDVAIQVTFDPETYATAMPVAASPLVKDVTPTAPALTHGDIFVTCEQTTITRIVRFGPFESLVH